MWDRDQVMRVSTESPPVKPTCDEEGKGVQFEELSEAAIIFTKVGGELHRPSRPAEIGSTQWRRRQGHGRKIPV